METSLEYILTHAHKDEMIVWVGENPESIEEMIALAIQDKQPYSWRAAWLLWSCIDTNDLRLRKYISSILKAIPNKKEGHQRELVKILMKMKLSDDDEGKLYDLCVGLWKRIESQPSIRFTALKFMTEMTLKHSELYNEYDFLTQESYVNTLTPGAKRSAMKMIATIRKHYDS